MKIQHYFGDKPIHFALYLGVDATFVVHGYQIIRYHTNIFGGSPSNHCLEIGDKSKE